MFDKFKNISLDFIFHLGEYSRVEQSFEDIDKVFEFNTNSFFEVIKLTKKHNAKLIYCGSSTKFSKDLNKVESPYSLTKRINTELLKYYAKWTKIDYAITYFYNVYGENEISEGKYGTVIGKFIKLKNSGADFLTVNRPGSQLRMFTHIDDIVDGLVVVADRGYGDNYGIGSSKKYSILEIAKLFKMKIRLGPKKLGNRLDSDLKVNKTKKLGWKPKRNIKDYIKLNINEF